jgi:hypothetical protein
MLRGRALLTLPVLAASCLSVVAVTAAPPANGLSAANPVVTWDGGPITGTAADPADCSSGPAGCDDVPLTLAIPASYWADHDGGVSIRIDWTAPETELDLHVFDPQLREIANEVYGGRGHQQVYLHAPAAGVYHVHVVGFDPVNVTYRGTATVHNVPTVGVSEKTGGMAFRASVVDPQVLAIEPGLALDDAGHVYTDSPWGVQDPVSFAWGSTDGGRTFALLDQKLGEVPVPTHMPCAGAVGGADSDIAVDRTGRLYFATLQPSAISVGSSADHGHTWSCVPVSNSTPENDRPWLSAAPTADGSGPGVDAYLSYMDLVVGQLPGGRDLKPIRIHIDVTRDGGHTWSAGTEFGRGQVPVGGPVFTEPDGTVHEVFQADEAVWLATSTDDAATFTVHKVSQRLGDPDNNWVLGAADGDGNVYVAWSDPGSYALLMSVSRDHGAHFRRPLRVSPPGQLAVLPWITAGAGGDVALAWYGADEGAGPDLAANGTAWTVWASRSLDADTRAPTFVRSAVSDTPAHLGALCMLACTGNHSRLGDFLEAAIDKRGALYVSYNDNARVDDVEAPPLPYVLVAREVAGTGMAPDALRALASDREPRGDAAGAPQLDFASRPTVFGGATLTFRLANAHSLHDALGGGAGGWATDAYWLLLWRTGARTEYAVMHLGANGHPEFYCGDQPVGVKDVSGLKEAIATYPAGRRLPGTVDAATGAIRITLDLAALHLAPGDTLHGLQAFALVGRGSPSELNLPAVVDSTPATNVVLPAAG